MEDREYPDMDEVDLNHKTVCSSYDMKVAKCSVNEVLLPRGLVGKEDIFD